MGSFFADSSSRKIVQAIHDVEQKTYAEIRVHIEDDCPSNPVDRALEVFHKLKMSNTKNQSGVLIYISTDDKKIAVIGDVGIHQQVGNDYWDRIVQDMIRVIAQKDLTDGIVYGIEEIGKKLIRYFPERSTVVDELPNEISYGKI